MPKINSEIKR